MSGKLTPLCVVCLFVFLVVPKYSQAEDFPKSWFYSVDAEKRAKMDRLVGKPAPMLKLSGWVNGKAAHSIKGKILLVDFWATWCGPCIRNIPHVNEMAAKYAEHGVVVLGVCTSSGQENFAKIVKQYKIAYPAAKDANSVSAKAWGVQFYPTYALVGRDGNVLAVGLTADGSEKAIEKLLTDEGVELKVAEADVAEEGVASVGTAKIKTAWLEGDAGLRARLRGIEGKAPPALDLENWINAKGMGLDDLKGKVVLLDFWATWCGPCLSAVPHTNAMAKKYYDRGLRIIGVCNTRGAETMASTVKKHGIEYPVAADIGNQAVSAYKVNGFPDYYLIDRFGKLRIADCANSSVEEAIEALLAEQVAAE